MNCKCIEVVNKVLAKEGYRLTTGFRIVPTTKKRKRTNEIVTTLSLRTEWIDQTKRRRKQPPVIIVSNCPFCGVKA